MTVGVMSRGVFYFKTKNNWENELKVLENEIYTLIFF